MKTAEFIYLGLAMLTICLILICVALIIAYRRAESERLELVIKVEELKLLLRLWE